MPDKNSKRKNKKRLQPPQEVDWTKVALDGVGIVIIAVFMILGMQDLAAMLIWGFAGYLLARSDRRNKLVSGIVGFAVACVIFAIDPIIPLQTWTVRFIEFAQCVALPLLIAAFIWLTLSVWKVVAQKVKTLINQLNEATREKTPPQA
ncbi:hypothetical protein M1271_00930 [Patescibacteria group bacterium]|nr:hypothetical protein [Patescibacteria group bacterium]